MFARNPRRSLDLCHERRAVGDDRTVKRTAAEERAGQTFVHERLVIGQQAHRVENGHDGRRAGAAGRSIRSEEHTSELQSQSNLVCRLLLEKKNKKKWM